MKVIFEIDKKTFELAKALMLQFADSADDEKEIDEVCQKCENATIELPAEEFGKEQTKELSLALAMAGMMVSLNGKYGK